MSKYKERECPGCGHPYRMPADTICLECSLQLADYENMKALVEVSGRKTRRFGFNTRAPLPYCIGVEKGSEVTEEFRDTILQLIDSLSPVIAAENGALVGGGEGFDGPSSGYGWRTTLTFMADESFGEAYRNFLWKLKAVLLSQYNAGQVRGQHLLSQLNDGSLSMDDFEEKRDRAANNK